MTPINIGLVEESKGERREGVGAKRIGVLLLCPLGVWQPGVPVRSGDLASSRRHWRDRDFLLG